MLRQIQAIALWHLTAAALKTVADYLPRRSPGFRNPSSLAPSRAFCPADGRALDPPTLAGRGCPARPRHSRQGPNPGDMPAFEDSLACAGCSDHRVERQRARAAHCKGLALEPNSAGRSPVTSGFTRTRIRASASRIFSRRNTSARKIPNLNSRTGIVSSRLRSCPPLTPRGPRPASSCWRRRCDVLAGKLPQLVLVCEDHLGVLLFGLLFGASARPSVNGWDQAAACERRSHSTKPMRPRRASPNGTSERSSTRPPKYRASGSLTTVRGSPIAFR